MTTSGPLTKGQLVRYSETTKRWRFALVIRVSAEEVELRFFGERKTSTVLLEQVEGFDAYLESRNGPFTVKRSRLAELFYGRVFSRLPSRRQPEMKRALGKAGISFEPVVWSTADTTIRLRRDRSIVKRDGTNTALKALLPQWLEPFVMPSGSRDPLGLQAHAEKLVNEVLPGITVFTYRAGYYGFLTWAIRTVNGLSGEKLPPGISRRELLDALERALVLCEFVYHGREDDSCRVIGQRSKLRVLSGNEGDRYRVPESILKNQSSAGSFRLFGTSLVSLGLAEEADELASEGMLPFRLSPLGDRLASVFARCVDPGLMRFAMGKRLESRASLRRWGERLCFSSIARTGDFRKYFIKGLLLGNSRDMEKRYATVAMLSDHGLLATNTGDASTHENLSEEDATIAEDGAYGAVISNWSLVLYFYGRAPRTELRQIQALSVFEMLSLGLTALFRAAVASVNGAGRADIAGLTRSISSAGDLATLWRTPMVAARPGTVRQLAARVLQCSDSVEAASIGGALLLRVIRDSLLPTVWDLVSLAAREPAELIDLYLRQRMDLSLAEALPSLLLAMVERHELVSERKSRQRWLFAQGPELIRDDLQDLGLGLHALRFPQLGSLARDVGLHNEDLHRG